MKLISLVLLFLAGIVWSCSEKENISYSQKIDFDWQFHQGDVENGQNPDLNTSDWRLLDLPHDWSIEGTYSLEHGSDWQSGFLPTGIGWYRKTLNWDPSWKNRRIKIHFEGVYLNSDVWINGVHLGHRPNGYIGFEYDLTDYLRKGENIVAVRVDQSKPLTGRWHTGSGIYRHVWLKTSGSVYVDNWGVSFTASNISTEKSDYEVTVDVLNKSDKDDQVQVTALLFDKDGSQVANLNETLKVASKGIQTVNLLGDISKPDLWSPETPVLYTLKTRISKGEQVLDESEMKVGFRKIEFSAAFGFKLNGKVTKLKGVCDHHTAGAVGAAVPDDVLLYRLRLLKEMGCNAIRTAHNPFSPSFYNICDSIGLMVMNEFLDGWDTEKAEHDYGLYFEEWWQKDGIDFIKRDRNHPSVVIWSIGNEVINPTREVQKQLVDLFHQFDPTRPVTQGGHDPTRDMTEENLHVQLDVKGFNGDGEEKGMLEKFHALEPSMPIVCTEVPHTYQTRGLYRTKTHWRRRDFPAMWEIGKWDGTLRGLEESLFPIPDLKSPEVFTEEKCSTYYINGEEKSIDIIKPYQYNLYYQSSYDNASVRSSARMAWQRTRDLDYVIGQFRWGSFDYLGESNDWPSRFANFGVIDICGFPKDHFYLYQSMWTEKPMVHILPHWTHPGKEGKKIPVVVYTNCDEVELFLNGESLGTKKYADEQLVWLVPYEPGMIKAIAKKNSKLAAGDKQITAGPPAKIELIPDKEKVYANRTDVVHVSVDITDENGIFCPMANNVVEFEMTGPARIIGVDNGDPLDLSAYKTNVRRAFRGKIMLLVQATDEEGDISIRAKSEGLEEMEVKLVSFK
ncbi:MAG: DUF4982 domain-containing protein [Bacteroidales bacterium]|nr:DUF4982 domain-containing protein [Bacteroidales bacterium]